MLFNSYVFILLFSPIALFGFFLSVRGGDLIGRGPLIGACWLIGISLVFYAWWRPPYVLVLTLSILGNYMISRLIDWTGSQSVWQRVILVFGIGANILALAYFKYFSSVVDFLIQNDVVATKHVDITLPLGISFFTFTQIGYLIDCQQGMAKN